MKESKVVNFTKFNVDEFKTSSFTGRKTMQCVEVALRPNVIGVRHSRDEMKTTLEFSRGEWEAFIKGVKCGEFDI